LQQSLINAHLLDVSSEITRNLLRFIAGKAIFRTAKSMYAKKRII